MIIDRGLHPFYDYLSDVKLIMFGSFMTTRSAHGVLPPPPFHPVPLSFDLLPDALVKPPILFPNHKRIPVFYSESDGLGWVGAPVSCMGTGSHICIRIRFVLIRKSFP